MVCPLHPAIGVAGCICPRDSTSTPTFESPAGKLPAKGGTPTTEEDTKKTEEELNKFADKLPWGLRHLHKVLFKIVEVEIQFLGLPMFYLGAALVTTGVLQTCYTLVYHLSSSQLKQSSALLNLMVGSLLLFCGRDMMARKGVSGLLSYLLWLSGNFIKV